MKLKEVYFMLIFNFIKKNLLQGIYLLLPVLITWYIIKIIIDFLSTNFYWIHSYIGIPILKEIPYSEILIIIILIFSIGLINSFIKIEKIIYFLEDFILNRIPVVSSFYQGIKEVTKLVKKNNSQKEETQIVAWIRIPKLNIYTLGLFTGELEDKYKPDQSKKFYSFFIPTTPNPVTGYYVIATSEDFIFTTMTKQEAISIIISGGIIRPEKKDIDKK